MNSLEMYQERVKRILSLVECSPYLTTRLLNPHDVYTFYHIPVFGRDGTLKGEYTAWLSLWWSQWLRKRGGIRYDKYVTEEETAALSALMGIKNSLLGLAYGGAKLGAKIDPTKHTEYELGNFTQNLIERCRFVLGKPYFAAPDMNTADKIGIMLHKFAKVNPHPEISPYKVFSGKPELILGLGSRTEATGRGAIIMTEFMLTNGAYRPRKSLSKATIAIQGFGQVARPFFKYAEEHGALVIAVSDVDSGFYNRNGISYTKLEQVMKNKQSFAELKENTLGDHITNDELLTMPCEIRVLAAREGQMTKDRAQRNKDCLHIEIANNPTDLDAEPILKEQGVTTFPDVAFNSGGVYVSSEEVEAGEEWSDEQKVIKNLERAMHAAGTKIIEAMKNHALDMRDASFLVSIQRTVQQVKAMRIETVD